MCVPCTSTLNIFYRSLCYVSFSIGARTPSGDDTLPPPAPRVKSTLVDADDAEKKMDSGFSELSILDDVNVADQLVRSEPVRRSCMFCRFMFVCAFLMLGASGVSLAYILLVGTLHAYLH